MKAKVYTVIFLSLTFVFGISKDLFGQDYELVWSDEFDGTSVDLAKWAFQIGDGCDIGICGWGNNELQWYQASNSSVENGMLTIAGKQENVSGKEYTSSRLRTKGLAEWKYGRFEMRAKMPLGAGTWPAFWMLPSDDVYGGWAASGEIDIVEFIGREPNEIHGTIHFGGSWPQNQQSGNSYTFPSGTPSDDFHVYAIEWEENQMRWYVDDVLYSTKTTWNTTGHAFPAPFDQNFHLLINFAIGGNWPGSPDASTTFPQTYQIDYVRVYQKMVTTDTEDSPKLGLNFIRNYPNPFENKTTIEYSLSEVTKVKLEVFDMLGRSVALLVDETKQLGKHQTTFLANHLPPGVYYLDFETDHFSKGELLHLGR